MGFTTSPPTHPPAPSCAPRFGDFQRLSVYTRSTLAEQTTPVLAEFSDIFATVDAW